MAPENQQDKLKQENYASEVLKASREILQGINLHDVPTLDAMPDDQFRNFCQFCYTVFISPHFDDIIRVLYHTQLMFAVNKSTTWEHDLFARANMNGIKLVEEMFQKYANIYHTKFSPGKESQEFDPQKSFASADELAKKFPQVSTKDK